MKTKTTQQPGCDKAGAARQPRKMWRAFSEQHVGAVRHFVSTQKIDGAEAGIWLPCDAASVAELKEEVRQAILCQIDCDTPDLILSHDTADAVLAVFGLGH